jgi:hypothetical protein
LGSLLLFSRLAASWSALGLPLLRVCSIFSPGHHFIETLDSTRGIHAAAVSYFICPGMVRNVPSTRSSHVRPGADRLHHHLRRLRYPGCWINYILDSHQSVLREHHLAFIETTFTNGRFDIATIRLRRYHVWSIRCHSSLSRADFRPCEWATLRSGIDPPSCPLYQRFEATEFNRTQLTHSPVFCPILGVAWLSLIWAGESFHCLVLDVGSDTAIQYERTTRARSSHS